MTGFILEKILDIVFSEFSIKTKLHIFDFFGNDWVIIVSGRLIDESLIENTLEQQVEIGHKSCIVTVLVLLENRLESEVNFSLIWINLLLTREACKELEASDECETPEVSHDSMAGRLPATVCPRPTR